MSISSCGVCSEVAISNRIRAQLFFQLPQIGPLGGQPLLDLRRLGPRGLDFRPLGLEVLARLRQFVGPRGHFAALPLERLGLLGLAARLVGEFLLPTLQVFGDGRECRPVGVQSLPFGGQAELCLGQLGLAPFEHLLPLLRACR